ncbi:uncharacterized protein [Labrus bergylta]|uniref:uncharacterized protein n=1 Tax=Labrus bergylta TaxID=56723 RepID=UPI003313408D
MDFLTCAILNGPFAFFSIMVNLFYAFCIVRPNHGMRIKQPLKLLLSSVIFCNLIYLISACLLFLVNVSKENVYFLLASYVVFAWSLSTSKSSCVWLNFFYCTKIVPAQTDLFVWIKKKIKPVIYCIWLVERIWGLVETGVILFDYLNLNNHIYISWSYNITMPPGAVYIHIPSTFKSNVYDTAKHIVHGHFFLSFSVMMISSGSTVAYLCTHMHRMVGNCLPCSSVRSQVRVTVTGIVQGLLYFFCSMVTVYKDFSEPVSKELLNPYTLFTLINFYMTGSSLTLGAGQSLFRRRVEGMWLRAAQCCKAN